MAAPAPIEKLRAVYQKWHDTRGQSADDWLAVMADDICVRSLADGAEKMEFSAMRRGKDAVRDYLNGIHADWEMLSHPAEEFVVDGDRVVVFGRCEWKHKRTGKVAQSPYIHRLVFRDGLVVEFSEFYDTAKAFAAATPD